MYVSFFCKLIRINVFLFSQHGIRAIKKFENARVRVSSCGQFWQPIQRPCHNSVALQSSRSQTIVGVACRQQLLPVRFSGDLHSGRRAHQQERLPPIYLPVEASSENNITRAHTCRSSVRRVNSRTDTWWRV